MGTQWPTQPSCLHEMFETAVRRAPEAIALVAGDASVSYRELNHRANALARRLRGLGVGPELAVGVRLGRSVDLVVSLLATLKAGGVYVPLEPAFPARRCASMLMRSGARFLVTRTDAG